MKQILRYLLIAAFGCAVGAVSAQEKASGLLLDAITITKTDTVYRLTFDLIIRGSESARLDSSAAPSHFNSFRIDYRSGLLIIDSRVRDSLLVGRTTRLLLLQYRRIPLTLKKEYSLRSLVIRRDSATGSRVYSISKPVSSYSTDALFGPDLQKSGSIVRGFTVGSNRDMTLNSGFRMQLSGKLASDLEITAALTDENSPIQPEGTTQTLQEVDKVFIEIRSRNYGATLGDFTIDIGASEGGEFGRIARKVQGARGFAAMPAGQPGFASGGVQAIGAVSRGKYHTNQIQGIEGSQGAYRLTGKNGEQRLLVIAGSERVYLNGELMTRGENNDYVIDYASGELTFTTKRLITNASRIIVDFEYSDRQFTRNLLGGSVNGTLFDKRMKLNFSYLQEADDPSSPIDVTLDDASRRIIGAAGTDRFKASTTGVSYAGIDSVTGFGKGQYIRRDTTLQSGRTIPIFVYAPGDPLAMYTVSFSSVDNVPADSAGYVRESIGKYRFAGVGQGNYMPLQFLPIPQLQRFFDVNGSGAIAKDLTVQGEYAVSQIDNNRLSNLPGVVQSGNAFKAGVAWSPRNIEAAGIRFGDIDLQFSERFVSGAFVAPDRANDVEFDRKWNIETTKQVDEEIREFSAAIAPSSRFRFSGGYGSLERKGYVSSSRTTGEALYRDSAGMNAMYRIEQISSENSLLSESSSWTRQLGNAQVPVHGMIPGMRIESEKRLTTLSGSDSALGGSFRFLEAAPRLSVPVFWMFSLAGEVQVRTEDSAVGGALRHASDALTQTYSLQMREWNSLTSMLSLTTRRVEFTGEFRQRGNANNDLLMVRSQTRYNPLRRAIESELFYEFTTQRTSKPERVFIRVQKGTGSYIYKGDTNGNGVADDTEFEPTRFDGDYVALLLLSDQLIPVVDLRSSARLRLTPSRIWTSADGGIRGFLRNFSSETTVRVEEKSTETDTKRIYLLDFSRFQNEKTTIAGSNMITQDLHLFENAPDLSFRLRFSERRSMTQYVSGNERGYSRERSLRIRSQLVTEISNQTEASNKIDRVSAPTGSYRARNLESNGLTSDFSYRPERVWEIGFVLDVSEVVDYLPALQPTVAINAQSFRLVYSILGAGQMRAQVQREEVRLVQGKSDPLNPFPFEFTNGKELGQSFLWSFNFDYRLTGNLQLTISYQGRSEGGRSPIHTARMEARAFF